MNPTTAEVYPTNRGWGWRIIDQTTGEVVCRSHLYYARSLSAYTNLLHTLQPIPATQILFKPRQPEPDYSQLYDGLPDADDDDLTAGNIRARMLIRDEGPDSQADEIPEPRRGFNEAAGRGA
jgi:hypothetical protein